MDPLNPWLDPSEVRHLAEQLLRPVSPARLAAADPGFNPSFVGFTDPDRQSMETLPPLEDAKPFPALDVPEITFQTPALIEAISEPLPQIPEPPLTPEIRLKQRLAIFQNWFSSRFQATEIFILGENGEVLFDESDHGRLHHMARNLNLSSQERQNLNVHVKIGPASVLELIPCETSMGRIVLGALVPATLPAASVSTISEVLIQTLS